MSKEFFIEFPYKERGIYAEFLKEVIKIIRDNGRIFLGVYNFINEEESAFIIEYNSEEQENKLKPLIEKYNLAIRVDKTVKELLIERVNKKWYFVLIPTDVPYYRSIEIFLDYFYFINKDI